MTNNKEEMKSMLKSDEEVRQFIQEQKELRRICEETDYENIQWYEEPFSYKVIEKWLGKEFMQATELPQHKFMLEEEMPVYERVYTYYPLLWNELIKIEEQRIMNALYQFRSYEFVTSRMDFINRYPANKVRWLSYLNDNDLTKEQWAINFGKNVHRQYKSYLMRIYHVRDDFTPNYTPDLYGTVNVLDRERYKNICHYEAMELINKMFIYNTNMAVASHEPAII